MRVISSFRLRTHSPRPTTAPAIQLPAEIQNQSRIPPPPSPSPAPMLPTTPPTPKKKLLCFSFGFGCREAKSVSVSTPTTTTTATIASKLQHEVSSAITSSLSSDEQRAASLTPSNSKNEETDAPPTFSGLLQQLSELEEGVLSLDGNCQMDKARRGVAVVKESEDPVGDFRVSMVQMMAEEEIATADEVAELVGRFLALNPPEHHPFILRAFAQIWQQVFSRSQTALSFPPPNYY